MDSQTIKDEVLQLLERGPTTANELFDRSAVAQTPSQIAAALHQLKGEGRVTPAGIAAGKWRYKLAEKAPAEEPRQAPKAKAAGKRRRRPSADEPTSFDHVLAALHPGESLTAKQISGRCPEGVTAEAVSKACWMLHERRLVRKVKGSDGKNRYSLIGEPVAATAEPSASEPVAQPATQAEVDAAVAGLDAGCAASGSAPACFGWWSDGTLEIRHGEDCVHLGPENARRLFTFLSNIRDVDTILLGGEPS